MSARDHRVIFLQAEWRDQSDLLLFSQRPWGRAQRLTYQATLMNALQTLVTQESPMPRWQALYPT